jgi:hypothetical protein
VGTLGLTTFAIITGVLVFITAGVKVFDYLIMAREMLQYRQ